MASMAIIPRFPEVSWHSALVYTTAAILLIISANLMLHPIDPAAHPGLFRIMLPIPASNPAMEHLFDPQGSGLDEDVLFMVLSTKLCPPCLVEAEGYADVAAGLGVDRKQIVIAFVDSQRTAAERLIKIGSWRHQPLYLEPVDWVTQMVDRVSVSGGHQILVLDLSENIHRFTIKLNNNTITPRRQKEEILRTVLE